MRASSSSPGVARVPTEVAFEEVVVSRERIDDGGTQVEVVDPCDAAGLDSPVLFESQECIKPNVPHFFVFVAL